MPKVVFHCLMRCQHMLPDTYILRKGELTQIFLKDSRLMDRPLEPYSVPAAAVAVAGRAARWPS